MNCEIMIVAEKQIQLKNGTAVTLRSPEASDAAAVNEHRRITSEETYFMARYPEELNFDGEAMKAQLDTVNRDDRDFGISAFYDGRLVADCRVSKLGPHIKYRHRGYFGISIQKEFWGQGLGTAMLREAIRIAGENGFEQLELGVFSDNPRAVHVYEKAGFQVCGVQPRAFKLKDGTYRDEIMMVKFL